MKLSNDTKKNDNAFQKYFQNKTRLFKKFMVSNYYVETKTYYQQTS